MDQQTKVALKHDQFVDTTAHGLSWAGENRRSVIVAVAIALLVIVIAVCGILFYNHRAEQAETAFGAAMAAYQTPLAQPGQPVPPGVSTFPSAVERAKAANAQFLAVSNQYGLTPSGKLALYFVGLTFVEAGQNSAAEDALKKSATSWDKDLSALAKLALAQLYRQTSRDQQAIDLYNQLDARPTSTVPVGLAKLQLAELYDSEGKTAEAKKIYAALKDKDAKGTIGMMAAEKLNPTGPGAGAGAAAAQ